MQRGDESFVISLHSNGNLQFCSLSDFSHIYNFKTFRDKEKNYQICSMKLFGKNDDKTNIILHIFDKELKITIFRSFNIEIELNNGDYIFNEEHQGDKIISDKVN